MVNGGKKGDKNESIMGRNSIIKSGQSRNTKTRGEQWREERRELGVGGETKRIE